MVNTVLGPMETSEMGRTLMHLGKNGWMKMRLLS